jgi:hypothetical protein
MANQIPPWNGLSQSLRFLPKDRRLGERDWVLAWISSANDWISSEAFGGTRLIMARLKLTLSCLACSAAPTRKFEVELGFPGGFPLNEISGCEQAISCRTSHKLRFRVWRQYIKKDRLIPKSAKSNKFKAGYRRASFLWQVFLWQVLFVKCTCVYATNFIWQVFIWQVLITGVNVSTSLLWQFIYSSQLANHIKCSDYFDKFSLLTHKDEQNWFVLWQFFLWQVHLFKS